MMIRFKYTKICILVNQNFVQGGSMLKERIKILRNAEMINDSTEEFVLRVIDDLQERFEDKEVALEMFTTHLAMCTQRVLNHEEVENLSDEIWDQVTQSNEYEKSLSLLQELLSYAPCEIPESEKRFLVMHLCSLHQ